MIETEIVVTVKPSYAEPEREFARHELLNVSGYSARAQIFTFPNGQRVADTCTHWCESRSKEQAISYALTEAAEMFERGMVTL